MVEKKYIDTEEARRIIERIRDHCGNDDMAFALNWAADCIVDASTTDVREVRHGHWFFTDYDYFDCSECGESYYNGCDSSAEARKRLQTGQDVYDYCPYCGAIMDGGTDNAT